MICPRIGWIASIIGTLLVAGCFVWIYIITYMSGLNFILLIIAVILLVLGIVLLIWGWRKTKPPEY